VIEKQQVW